MKKGPGLGQFMAVLTTMQSTAEKVKEVEDSSSISSEEGNDEPFELRVEDYPVPLQLVYHLLFRNTEVRPSIAMQSAKIVGEKNYLRTV